MEQSSYSKLADITKILNRNLDLHEIFMHINKAISEEIVQCIAVGIFLPEEDRTFRGFAGTETINGVSIDMLVIDPEKDLLAKELIELKKTIYIPDTSKDDRPDPKMKEIFKIKSLLALPITLGEELFGLVFLFEYGAPMKLTGLEIKCVEAYVKLAAVAIQNANYLKQKEDLLAQNQLLLGLSRDLTKCFSTDESLEVCFSNLKRILGAHIIAEACIFDPIDKKINSIKLSSGTNEPDLEQSFHEIVQEVIRTKKAVYIPNILSDGRVNPEECQNVDIKALMAVPFVSAGEVLGAIIVADKERNGPGDHECVIQLARSIVDATAPVFSNLQYLNQLENMVVERTRKLTAANAKVASVIEGITGGFFALDKDWKFTYVKPQFLPQSKLAKELLGKNIWEVFPESVGTVMYNELHRAMSGRISLQFEYHSANGESWYEIAAFPYEDGICGLVEDITEKKKYEKELNRLSSLNLIGQMAAGISHEIRNPMTTVRGFLQLLVMENDYGKHRHYFEVMIEELDRVNSIITEFLSIGNTRTADLQMLNLNTIILGMAPLMEVDAVTQSKMIEIETEDVPELLLNDTEIRQLIMNLYRNGLEAMKAGGTLSIQTYKENGQVILAVQDQGEGISPEAMEKLGTPFFTTKDNGTGLGMGVCYAIAARHNAKIDIKTGPEGTTFFVKFKLG